MVLLGHPFGAVTGTPGTEVRALTLGADGQVVDDGQRLDLMVQPRIIRVTPSGTLALILAEDGTLTSVRLDAADALVPVDAIGLPMAGASDLQLSPDGATAWAIRSDVDAAGGVYTVEIACDGRLSPVAPHYSLRLAHALALFPGDAGRALLVGGQTVFDPIVDEDTRLLQLGEDGVWQETGAFDLWGDFVDTTGIAISGDGRTALVPNGSPFSEEGSQLMVVSIDGDDVIEAERLVDDFSDARQARFAPDGVTALVSRLEPGRVAVVYDDGGGWAAVDQLPVGLPDAIAFVRRGALAGTALIPAVSPSDGPQLVVVRVTAPGRAEVVERLGLGAGSPNIPGAIGLAP